VICAAVVLVLGISVIVLVVAMYFSVYKRCYAINKATRRVVGEVKIDEKRLFLRCVTLIAAFVLCFSPSMLVFIYEFSSKSKSPMWVEGTATLLSYSNMLISPVQLVYLSPKYWKKIGQELSSNANLSANNLKTVKSTSVNHLRSEKSIKNGMK
jgi:ABC-type Fe3+ transport system permease subunit